MARYQARVHHPRGGTRTIEVEASSPREAEQKASRHGRVLSTRKTSGKPMGKMSFGDRQTFLSRLSAMLASGIGAGEALRLMRDTFGGKIKHVSHDLLLHIDSGSNLPRAMEQVGDQYFPEAVTAMISAGSFSGATHKALRDAMEFEREMMRVRRESGKGIMQAVGSFIMAALFVIGSVFYFLPKVMESDLMKVGGGTDNLQWTIDVAYIIGYIMGGVGLIFTLFVLLGTVGRKIAPTIVDAIIMRIPFYKDLILAKNNYIAFYGLSLLVETGVRMETSLELMEKGTPPGALRADFRRAKKAVQDGKPWAHAMKTLEATDRAALGASLDRKQVANAMKAIAVQYRDIYAQRMAAFVPVLQGIAALFLMLSGLIMFGLTILPMLQMSSNIL